MVETFQYARQIRRLIARLLVAGTNREGERFVRHEKG